ncbi:hypothetical protein H310_13388 [Aphanomyces invadans]|uniref:Uncharacterized protein n=1 Tax=Aphanomyces invadans TaxID=157072 RepID=A0A024TG86_9STRA|nr:hypothetical protein H310_13388 [Aphanomyces invadans]ETV92347.1 hypothetical protein H310_13388 [Aphanomyces invadans]|eukprot:XP_008879098.1 hypothetical protein H310_13388 [Aphanomyces invadans]
MESLHPILMPRPTARCHPSAATLLASLPKLHMSSDEKDRLRSMRHQSFRRLQVNHIRCAQILHGTMQWRAVEFMNVGEETECLERQEHLRQEIKALEIINAKLAAAHSPNLPAASDRSLKRLRDSQPPPTKRIKTLTSL